MGRTVLPGRARPLTQVPSVAVLGLGLAGSTLHLPALRRLGADVLIAADPDPDPATHARAGRVPTTTDWHEALASGAGAIIVATPPATHAELTLAALRAGCHVYVEKPMTAGIEEAAAVRTAALAAGTVIQVGFAYRFHPLWRRVAGLLARGELRPPLRLDARFSAGCGPDPVLDLAPHHVDLTAWLLGSAPATARADGSEAITVEWDDGSVLRGIYRRAEHEDSVAIDDGAHTVLVDRLRGRRLRGTVAPRARLPLPGLAITRILRPNWERSFEAALGAFLAAAAGGPRDGAADVRAGETAVRVSDALARSTASGRAETVGGG